MVGKHKTKFILVRCNECSSEQMVYSHASTVVRCQTCSKTIAVPRGGKAEIKGVIIGKSE